MIMITLMLRLAFYGLLVYGFFLVAYPDWEGSAYHAVSVSAVLAAAVGLGLLLRVLDLTSRAARLAVELAFAAGVFAYFGYTLPLKQRAAPLKEWVEGKKPTRADAGAGLRRLGLDPDELPASFVVKLFPR